MRILGIDASLNGPGICVVTDGRIESTSTFKNPKKDLISKVAALRSYMDTVLWDFYHIIIIEKPQWQEERKQVACKNNTLVHLTVGFSTILNKVIEYEAYERLALVTPSTWKGQCPKEITKKRMMKYGSMVEHLSHDEVDALGLCDYILNE